MTFVAGQQVRVSPRSHAGHCRTPAYLRGKTGSVERLHGAFADPETRAYGSDGLPGLRLYQVGFAQTDLWPDYEGPPGDRLSVDVFEHWLEPAE